MQAPAIAIAAMPVSTNRLLVLRMLDVLVRWLSFARRKWGRCVVRSGASTYLPNESRPRMDAASNPGITTPASIGPFKYEYQFLI